MTILDDPLASVGVRGLPRTYGASGAKSYTTSCPETMPLVLRSLHPAPECDVPEYVYDPQRQIATDPAGAPLGPFLAKDWTSTEGTHTDGDGGDNESWGWEE
ncbi:MAG: putative ATP-grasp-modified RiPP [Pseudonocardiales bacterium]